jgi:hypothetical protein
MKKDKMTDIEKLETIVYEALSEYGKKYSLALSSLEYSAFSDQHEGSQGLTITLDNGKVFNLLILDAES